MSAREIGDVLVQNGGDVCIVTDRDVVVRVIAEGRDPASTRVRRRVHHRASRP